MNDEVKMAEMEAKFVNCASLLRDGPKVELSAAEAVLLVEFARLGSVLVYESEVPGDRTREMVAAFKKSSPYNQKTPELCTLVLVVCHNVGDRAVASASTMPTKGHTR